MIRYLLAVATVGFIFFANSHSWAQSSFKGYAKEADAETYEVHERLLRFQKEKKDFYLYITNHETLYRFPRSDDIDQQIERFLQSRKKKSALLKIELNRKTTEIHRIGDG